MRFLRPFFFGITASFGALFLELTFGIFDSGPLEIGDAFFYRITPLLVVAALIEEILKFFFVYRNYQSLRSVSTNIGDLARETFFGSLAIGMGFSLIELIFIFFNFTDAETFLKTGAAALGIFVIHSFTASIAGYQLSISKLNDYFFVFKIILATLCFHIAYNLLIVYSAHYWITLIYLAVLLAIFFITARIVVNRR